MLLPPSTKINRLKLTSSEITTSLVVWITSRLLYIIFNGNTSWFLLTLLIWKQPSNQLVFVPRDTTYPSLNITTTKSVAPCIILLQASIYIGTLPWIFYVVPTDLQTYTSISSFSYTMYSFTSNFFLRFWYDPLTCTYTKIFVIQYSTLKSENHYYH